MTGQKCMTNNPIVSRLPTTLESIKPFTCREYMLCHIAAVNPIKSRYINFMPLTRNQGTKTVTAMARYDLLKIFKKYGERRTTGCCKTGGRWPSQWLSGAKMWRDTLTLSASVLTYTSTSFDKQRPSPKGKSPVPNCDSGLIWNVLSKRPGKYVPTSRKTHRKYTGL